MSRHVKGVLFADYVRMIRGHKGVDWTRHLAPDDLPFIAAKIDPASWYPMATFERLGNAILAEIAHGSLEAVRMWGRFSADPLYEANRALVAEGDPVDTLMRFRVLRSTYFDFEAIEIPSLTTGEATVVIHYFMAAAAEEAASIQTAGFFERVLEIAGATDVRGEFRERSWRGDRRTVVDLTWRGPLA